MQILVEKKAEKKLRSALSTIASLHEIISYHVAFCSYLLIIIMISIYLLFIHIRHSFS
jgi:hypothetical protein